MSDYEQYKGTLTPVDDIEVKAEESAIRILGDKYDKEYGAEEQLTDEYYKDYVIYNDRVYKVDKEEQDPYDDIMDATDNGDGSFSFHVKYYNGGCCMNEAIEGAMDKLGAV